MGTLVPVSGHFGSGLAHDASTGTMYAASTTGNTESALYTVDTGTGLATHVGTSPVAKSVVDPAADLSGNLYAHDLSGNQIRSIPDRLGCRGQQGRPVLLRLQWTASEHLGQRLELPVRDAAGDARGPPDRESSGGAVRRSVHAGPRRTLDDQARSELGAGAVVQAQLWYRDPLNTSNQTTSLSDAIEFIVAPCYGQTWSAPLPAARPSYR